MSHVAHFHSRRDWQLHSSQGKVQANLRSLLYHPPSPRELMWARDAGVEATSVAPSLLSPWGPALARQGCCWLDSLNSGNRSSGAMLHPSCTSHKAQSLIFTCVHEERG